MILKYIEKQLKLRTIRILREKHLNEFTCVAVRSIPFGMAKWYREQVKDFGMNKWYREQVKGLANMFNLSEVPFSFLILSIVRNTSVSEERKIFLDWLEQEVIAGRK